MNWIRPSAASVLCRVVALASWASWEGTAAAQGDTRGSLVRQELDEDFIDVYGTPQEVGVTRYIALMFSAQHYQGGALQDLKTPTADIHVIGETLQHQYSFDVHYYEDATRKVILDALEEQVNNGQEGDVVLIYYAGHGELKEREGRGYWLPVDAGLSTANAVSTDDVAAKVEAMPARHVLVVADSCFSGALLRSPATNAAATKAAPAHTEAVGLARLRSRYVLTSGGLQPVNDRGVNGVSLFAYYFEQSLRQTDERYVILDRLYPNLRQWVMVNSPDKGRPQIPQQGPIAGAVQTDGRMVLLNNNACRPTLAVNVERQKREAVREWDEDVAPLAGAKPEDYLAAVNAYIGRWSDTRISECQQQVTVEIDTLGEAIRVRDALQGRVDPLERRSAVPIPTSAGGAHRGRFGTVALGVGGGLAATGGALVGWSVGWWNNNLDRFELSEDGSALVALDPEAATMYQRIQVLNPIGFALLAVGGVGVGVGGVDLLVGPGPGTGLQISGQLGGPRRSR